MKASILGLLVLLLLSGCDGDPARKLKPLVPAEKVVGEVSIDANFEIDILFVVDNSGSMSSHQSKLAAGMDAFTELFYKTEFLDFNIGVVSSDPGRWYLGKLTSRSGEKILTRNHSKSMLKDQFRLGTSGNGTETFFTPVEAALTEPLLSGHNQGFLRKDAFLAVIFLTDTDDQSRMRSDEFVDFLDNLKGKKNYLIAGALIQDRRTCEGEQKSTKLIEAIEAKNGNHFSICNTSFGPELAKIGQDLFERVSVLPLTRRPIVETIRLVYGDQVIPQGYEIGWTYDPQTNSLYLGSKIELKKQAKGTKLRVFFKEYTDQP